MPLKLDKLDNFTRNVIVVFVSTSFLNVLNLLFQLLIAHKLTPTDFSAFNSLLSVFMLISVPLGTLQLALAKYASAFNARGEESKTRFLFQAFFKWSFILSLLTLAIFFLASSFLLQLLKIDSVALGYLFAGLVASAWLAPVVLGTLQGLEIFWWLCAATLIPGIFKLGFAYFLIVFGHGTAGAMAALLISSLAAIFIGYPPLKKLLVSVKEKPAIDFKEIFVYLFPVALSYLCFTFITTFDMVLVRYYFSQESSGAYALAQMIGKIFLFLPGAISVVMFPRTSGLKARNEDTASVLKRSLSYVFILAAAAAIFYNIFPEFVLMALTGKTGPQAVLLGRLFSVSMTFYTLIFIQVNYFLSVRDMRFLRYLLPLSLAQVIGIVLFHPSLVAVQSVMCVSSALLFFSHIRLVYKK